jgi:hypothetical protein
LEWWGIIHKIVLPMRPWPSASVATNKDDLVSALCIKIRQMRAIFLCGNKRCERFAELNGNVSFRQDKA